MKSVMSHSFSMVPKAEIPRSSFDRSHGYKTTFDAGWLVPVYVDEVLPGDTVNLQMTAFGRLATPIHPFMDNMFVDSFFFAVPIRLIWENWEKFNGAQDNPTDSTDFLVPQINSDTGFGENSLEDYFGLPTGIADLDVSAFWHRAYYLIWNEWFRDENLQDSLTVPLGDGPDLASGYTLQRRGKRHDYFTSALPWPQKGPSVDLPLGTQAPVVGIGKGNQSWTTGSQTVYETGASASDTYTSFRSISTDDTNNIAYYEEDPDNPGFPGIFANLSETPLATD